MCSSTSTATTPSRNQGKAISLALVFVPLLLGSIFSYGVPSSVLYAATAAILGFLGLFVWFINYYNGEKLRECSPLIKHLAAKASAPEECISDLDKVANPEGLSQLWKDVLMNKGESYNILLTGLTGYVGHAFLYQLLREIDNGKKATGTKVNHKIYALARGKEGKGLSAAQRLEAIRDEAMFVPYKKQWDETVVAVQCGDLQEINCGMSEATLKLLADAKITHVVHCAADVNFNRPLRDSAGINISPALQLQSLAQQWSSCRRFVHCSTAFVNPGHGSPDKPMEEQLFALGKYDPKDLYDSMLGDQKLALAVKEQLGFANNYVFTKCIAEHLVVRNNKQMELRIVRPAVVGPSWVLPFPAWNGDKPSTITALVLLWGTRVIRFAPLVKGAVNVIPVDVVAISIIHAMIAPKTPDPVSIRNLIWSHKSPRDMIGGLEMADLCVAGAVMKQHFSYTESAISFALIDLTYRFPVLFPLLHLIFNLGPLYLLQFVCWAVRVCGIKSILEQVPVVKLLRFSDMLTLYKPYLGREYFFESSIDVPENMDMNQYCAGLFKATHSFWAKMFPGTIEDLNHLELLPSGRLDMWWAMTAPSRSFANRICAYLCCKILRKTHGKAFVDLNTMEDVVTAMLELDETMSEQKHCVLLASCDEQTPFDAMLTKFVAFSMAGLGLDLPYTFGKNDMNSESLSNLADIKRQYDRHATLAADFKDSDSSERFLRIVVNSTGEHDYTIVPFRMNFDRSKATTSKSMTQMSTFGILELVSLYWKVCIQGRHNNEFGNVKVSFGKPRKADKLSDLTEVVSFVQKEHERLMCVSSTDAAAAKADSKGPTDGMKEATQTAGASMTRSDRKLAHTGPLPKKDNGSVHEKWTPDLEPYINESHPEWASAIAERKLHTEHPAEALATGEFEANLKVIRTAFDTATIVAIRARTSLHEKNVPSPTEEEAVKEMVAIDKELEFTAGSFIVQAAASIALKKSLSPGVFARFEEEKKEEEKAHMARVGKY